MTTNAPIVKEQVTWIRLGKMGRQNVTHPTMYRLTEPDGYVRYFDTRAADAGVVGGELRDDLERTHPTDASPRHKVGAG